MNSISPGLILTPLNAYKGMEPAQLAETAEFFKSIQPLPEHGRPEYIAAGFIFLASDEAAWITGHNLVVDGGNSIHNLISRQVYDWIEQTS